MSITNLLVLSVTMVVLVVFLYLMAGKVFFNNKSKPDNTLKEKILPNILTISTYVFLLAVIALAADVWAMWNVFQSISQMYGSLNTLNTPDGAVTVIDVALITDFIIKALTAFTFHTIAMTALTGLIMIMKDVSTSPPAKSEVAIICEKLIDTLSGDDD